MNRGFFSEDAQEILDMASDIVRSCIKFRKYGEDRWQLKTWDAGWKQNKFLAVKYMPERLKDFYVLYDKFADRLREGVYTFGFLKGELNDR